METKLILQSSLFQLKVFEISFGLFLPCLLAAPRHVARHGHGTGEKVPTWALGGSAWTSPRSSVAHINIPPYYFFLSLPHLCYPCSLFHGSTFGVLHYQLLRYTLLACWDGTWPSLLSCTSSPAPGNLLDLTAMVSHQAQGLAMLSALPSLAAAFRQDRLNQSSIGLRACKVLPVPVCGHTQFFYIVQQSCKIWRDQLAWRRWIY